METDSNNSKKKVLFIVTQSEYGGAQRFIFNVALGLDANKYDIVVAFGATNESGKDFLETELAKHNIATYRLKYLSRNPNLYKDLRSIFEIRSYIRKNKFNTVFLNSSKAGFCGSIATFFPTRLKTRVIYRIGGWAFNDPRPKWQKFFIIASEYLSARWKDIIVVNCKKDYDDATRLHIRPREGVKIIYNGLDAFKIPSLERNNARAEIEKKLKIQDGTFEKKIIIGTQANFYPAKGLNYLVETAQRFANHDNVVFVIIGEGKLRSELESEIEAKKLRNTVFLTGFIKDAFKYFTAFDIFVLTSLKEGFPWAVLEAMTLKIPVIATGVGAIPEMIEDNKNGFIVEPKRPEQMGHRIEQLIKDYRLRQEFGIQAHQTVLFKFGLDKMINKVAEIL